MLKLGLRSVLAHRLRFVLCTVAVLLGIGFVSGAMIFTDTLSAALKKNFAGSTADLTVTTAPGPNDPGTEDGRTATLTSDIAHRIATVPGVASADAQLLLPGIEILGKDGKPIENYGLQAYAASWPHDQAGAPFTVVQGKPPWGQGQVSLDQTTARREGYELGQEVKIVTPAKSVTATLTAITTPALAGEAAGAPLVAFDPASAQLLLLGKAGWTSIAVSVQPGQDHEAVRQAVANELGSGPYTVRTAAQVSADGKNALDDVFGGFSTVLILFAALALFVGAFLIVNTFAMVVAQRSRELAMLRAIGASRSQVTGTVLAEAVVIGAVGSTAGLVLGIAVAGGIQLFYQTLDLAIPSANLQIGAATVIASYVLGIGITLAAAYPAARRAGKLPPVAAMREDHTVPERSLVVRLVLGGFLLLMALMLIAIALAARGLPGTVLLAFGAALTLLGIVLISPLISRYAVRWLMAPFGRRAPVTLGRRNAERNPRRTSATASALMISLALVSGLVVIAASAKASVDKGISDAIGTAEFVVVNEGGGGFSPQVGDRIAAVPGIAGVHRIRQLPARAGKTPVAVSGVSDDTLKGPITVAVDEGSVDRLGQGEVVVPRNLANELKLSVGGKLELTTTSGTRSLPVGAVIATNRQVDAVLVSLGTFAEIGGPGTDRTLYVDVAEGTDLGQVRQAVLDRLTDYPSLLVRDQQAYAAGERAPINAILGVVGALLGLAILIALLGIVNTLALGVVERTREIGLLRAIGMDGPQLRRMLQVESIAIAVLGALLGLVIGVLFGSMVQKVMSDDGLAVLDIPVLQLLLAVLVAAAVGVLAAIWPSRRAARLDVLRAISTE
ncbi:putative ABC transport system permease protein [Kribbella amoyensis]|uniref:Putative ABC transport system permease protein n=1 Tax=Kribbella amoyensis TaxID=996641 RepID=A0A561BZX2_9ACTN|nr:FtsX-like permease family protein [Kribbella amoyensis]TWD84465.1 putative ABC transport system permease protein [Kribbella amoyensis]